MLAAQKEEAETQLKKFMASEAGAMGKQVMNQRQEIKILRSQVHTMQESNSKLNKQVSFWLKFDFVLNSS